MVYHLRDNLYLDLLCADHRECESLVLDCKKGGVGEMKRIDIVDVKSDIRDGKLTVEINYTLDGTEVLLKDTQTGEAVCIHRF